MAQAGSPETTGRLLVLFAEGAADAGARALYDRAGLRVANTADAGRAGLTEAMAESDGLLLHDLELCVVRADPDQADAVRRGAPAGAAASPILLTEPERVVRVLGGAGGEQAGTGERSGAGEAELTWGLRALDVAGSTASGLGRRVAVLDTGFNPDHPDFEGRVVERESFVEGEGPEDAHGHGMHVVGTACGPREPAEGPGYGVAFDAEIYSGKVLDSGGAGTDGGILAGISWAVAHDCSVVCMSLGAPAEPDDPYSRAFEEAAARAMRRGTLVIAASGNESRRSEGVIAPVGHPANAPTILAVGAIDEQREIAEFSSATVGDVGQVDLVGPGVEVHSSWLMPERTTTISGTSMATPHVVGAAALIGEHHGARGWELWARLSQTARRLPLAATDAGAGLVQAPRDR